MSMTWHREIGLSVLVLSLLPTVVAAQDEARSLGELLRSGRLRLGHGVYVTDASGDRRKGTITNLSTAAVEVTHRGRTWSVAGDEVRRIERQDSLANGIGLGLLIGWASFYGACAASGARDCAILSTHPVIGGPYVLLGGAVGALVDARMLQTVYRARASGRPAVVPILSKGRFGARVSVGW